MRILIMSAGSECYLKEYDFLRAFCFVIFKMTIADSMKLEAGIDE